MRGQVTRGCLTQPSFEEMSRIDGGPHRVDIVFAHFQLARNARPPAMSASLEVLALFSSLPLEEPTGVLSAVNEWSVANV